MKNLSKKKWYKNIAIWAVFVAALGTAANLLYNEISKSYDFSITIRPFEGVVEKGQSINATLIIEGQKYNDQVKLTTKSQNDKIDISFDPSIGIPNPTFNSIINIKIDNSISVGDYPIEIIAVGAKNKIEHLTIFNLRVENPPFSPQKLVNLFMHDGWMGDVNDIIFEYDIMNSVSHQSCIKFTYKPSKPNESNLKGWVGLYWLYPNNNFGNQPEGRDLTGATKLSFMAKGERGGELVEFKVGGVSGQYADSFQPAVSKIITLTTDWMEYSISLEGKDLSNVFGGFCITTNIKQNPHGCTIFLDDIIFR